MKKENLTPEKIDQKIDELQTEYSSARKSAIGEFFGILGVTAAFIYAAGFAAMIIMSHNERMFAMLLVPTFAAMCISAISVIFYCILKLRKISSVILYLFVMVVSLPISFILYPALGLSKLKDYGIFSSGRARLLSEKISQLKIEKNKLASE